MNPIFQAAIHRLLRRQRETGKKQPVQDYTQAELDLYFHTRKDSLPGFKQLQRYGITGVIVATLGLLAFGLSFYTNAVDLGRLAVFLGCGLALALFLFAGLTLYAWQSARAVEREIRLREAEVKERQRKHLQDLNKGPVKE